MRLVVSSVRHWLKSSCRGRRFDAFRRVHLHWSKHRTGVHKDHPVTETDMVMRRLGSSTIFKNPFSFECARHTRQPPRIAPIPNSRTKRHSSMYIIFNYSPFNLSCLTLNASVRNSFSSLWCTLFRPVATLALGCLPAYMTCLLLWCSVLFSNVSILG